MPDRPSLTTTTAKTARPGSADYELRSTNAPGLRLRVRATGGRTFIFRARVRGGPMVTITIGVYGQPWSVKAAETEAARLMSLCRQGVDPRAEEKRAIVKRQVEDKKVLGTFASTAAAYLAVHADGRTPTSKRRKPTEAAHKREALSVSHAASIIGAEPVGHIGRREAVALRNALTHLSDSSRRHAFTAASRVMAFALEEGLAEVNVFSMMKAPHGSEARKRFLSEQEVRDVWHAAGDLAEPYGRLVRFLITTPVRLSNACDARWGDLSGDLLHLPQTKIGRPWDVALPKIALEVIGPRGADDARIFASAGRHGRNVGGSVASGMAKVKRALDEASGVEGWRLHDLRRTIATILSDCVPDFDRAAGSLWQQHVPPDRMMQVYNVSESIPAQRKCAAQWDAELRRIIGQNITSITTMERA